MQSWEQRKALQTPSCISYTSVQAPWWAGANTSIFPIHLRMRNLEIFPASVTTLNLTWSFEVHEKHNQKESSVLEHPGAQFDLGSYGKKSSKGNAPQCAAVLRPFLHWGFGRIRHTMNVPHYLCCLFWLLLAFSSGQKALQSLWERSRLSTALRCPGRCLTSPKNQSNRSRTASTRMPTAWLLPITVNRASICNQYTICHLST